MTRLALALALLLLGGCRFVKSPETVPCEDDEHCPTGYWCPLAGDATATCAEGSRPFDPNDRDGDGHEPPFDCDDDDPDVHPDADEFCGDGVDSNCDLLDEADRDGDGLSECEGDCDDADSTRYPGATEACDNVDSNCDGVTDDNDPAFDGDADGYTSCFGLDCDDDDEATHPQASELCDGEDNDCDGDIPSEESDGDSDGHRGCDGDCDDADPDAFPGNPEVCDAEDNDCDGELPDDEADDLDGDGFVACLDCQDDDASRFPASPELCDGVDNDCDEVVPSDESDGDGDGALECEDCDDGDPDAYPLAPELCDEKDNDCDGAPDPDETDLDNDTFLGCEECDDADDTAWPGAPELCDGADNDCDGALPADESDGDGDGEPPCAGDCDDADPARFSAAAEACTDAIDNDCDGDVDECNEWVVFSSDQAPAADLDLFITDAQQTTQLHLVDLPGHDTDAAISPSGTLVAFLNGVSFSWELMLLDLGSLELWALTDGDCPLGVTPPSWHPDGDRVVMGCVNDSGDLDFVEVTTDGVVTTLFEPTDDASDPAWSPDGTELAEVFVRTGGEHLIRSRDPSTGATTELLYTETELSLSNPVWSPDGAWLAYTAADFDSQHLRVVELAQTVATELTPPTFGIFDLHPAWSIDSTQLLFTREDGGVDSLWTVDVDGTNEAAWLEAAPSLLSSPALGLLPPGFTPGSSDDDGDGWTALDGDCDDGAPATFPAASELCDGQDNDCDAQLPADESDDDGDGFFPCDGDCDDLEESVYPFAPELCDGLDNDCDGSGDVCTDWVVFTSDRAAPGEYELWATDEGRTQFVQLTDLPGDQWQPKVNPAGSHVAFVDDSSGSTEVAVLELASLEITYDSADTPACPGITSEPNWHPTDNKLVVTCLNAGSNTFGEVDLDTGLFSDLWLAYQDLWAADWTADGTDLLYGGTDFFGRYDLDGATDVRFHGLTDGLADLRPDASPTDNWIIWTRSEGSNVQNIFRVDGDGNASTQLKLTNHPADERGRNGRFTPDGVHVLYTHRDAALHHSLRIIEALGYNDAAWLDEPGINNRQGDWATIDPASLPGSADADGDGSPVRFDCDDSDPLVYPGAADTTADAIDQDCDGFDGTAGPDDVVIVEFLYNPLGNDLCGEYFEVFNPTGAAVSLEGWIVGEGTTCGALAEQTKLGAGIVPAQGTLLVAAENGTGDCEGQDGYTGALRYPRDDVVLGEDDSLVLCRDGVQIDRVEWSPSTWSLPLNSGTATNFDQNLLPSTVDNEDPADWCHATSTSTLPLVNLGTPGTVNDPC